MASATRASIKVCIKIIPKCMLDALCILLEHLKIANSLLNDLWNSHYKSNRLETNCFLPF